MVKGLFLILLSLSFKQLAAQDEMKKLLVGGVQREYIVHVPKTFDRSKKHPLVFIFHGSGGSAKNSVSFFGMNSIADTAGFVAVYPNGLNHGWNDGRAVKHHDHDDIGFIRQLLQQLIEEYPIDEQRVFATGISNGGFFSFAIGLHLADKFRAIAPVCATIPTSVIRAYNPVKPVGLLLINGTKDPLVPYRGGKVGGNLMNRGQCTSTDETIAKYTQLNHCQMENPVNMPDKNRDDGCTATRFIYSCSTGNKVELIRIDGGGHTWPGGKQYLGKRLIGNVCRDFSAAEEVWNFFRHS